MTVRIWNLLDGDVNSPHLPLVCAAYGVDDVVLMMERLAMMRTYYKDQK